MPGTPGGPGGNPTGPRTMGPLGNPRDRGVFLVSAEEDYLPITDPDGDTLYYRIANGVITLYTSDPALIGTSVTDGDGIVWIQDVDSRRIYQVIGTLDPADESDLSLIAVPDVVT